MSGYPYGGNPPQYPPPQNQIYPQIYNPANAPPPGQPIHAAPGYPSGQNPQFPYQPGFAIYPTQPLQAGQAPPPAAMSYPSGPTAPPSYGYQGFPTVTPQPNYEAPVEWIPSTPNDAHTLSNRAVVAGYEGYDQSPLWVIRARYEGDMIPGKLAIKHKAAYVPWGGRENAVNNIEVCCARPEKVRWVESRDGMIPQNAIISGNTSAGEPLYIGRAREQGSLTPGKVHPSHKAMYLSFAGKEVPHKIYEILCTA
ncbi:annexin A7-like [Nymphalis io]|uniref:annexin A7-like n=1 Tax=Inachis io TaxID=171585 RepID=UPI0021672D43|nr:annexin A7-like [Nymphalis io]